MQVFSINPSCRSASAAAARARVMIRTRLRRLGIKPPAPEAGTRELIRAAIAAKAGA